MSLSLSTGTDRRLRLAGIAGVAGGALTLAGAVLQTQAQVETITVGDQMDVVTTFPLASYVCALLAAAAAAFAVDGLRRARAAGTTGFARFSQMTWLCYWVLMVATSLLRLAFISLLPLIWPVLTLTLLIGGPGSAICTIRAELLTGWRRWAPAALVASTAMSWVPASFGLVFYPVGALLPIVQSVTITLLGVALLTARGVGPAVAPVTGLPTTAVV